MKAKKVTVRRKTTRLINIAKVRRAKTKRVNPLVARIAALEDAHFNGAAAVTTELEAIQNQIDDLKVDHGSIHPDKLVMELVKKFKPHIVVVLIIGLLLGASLFIAILK